MESKWRQAAAPHEKHTDEAVLKQPAVFCLQVEDAVRAVAAKNNRPDPLLTGSRPLKMRYKPDKVITELRAALRSLIHGSAEKALPHGEDKECSVPGLPEQGNPTSRLCSWHRSCSLSPSDDVVLILSQAGAAAAAQLSWPPAAAGPRQPRLSGAAARCLAAGTLLLLPSFPIAHCSCFYLFTTGSHAGLLGRCS